MVSLTWAFTLFEFDDSRSTSGLASFGCPSQVYFSVVRFLAFVDKLPCEFQQQFQTSLQKLFCLARDLTTLGYDDL